MTERELNALPAELSNQLRYLDRKVRGLAALRGIAVVCAVLCCGVGVGILTDWLFDLGVGLRTAILLGVLGAALAAVVIAILRPLLRRSSSAELAALVDTSFPDLRERIESTVELANPDLPDSHKGSAYMRSRLMQEAVRQSHGVDFGSAADTSSAFRWVSIASVSFLLVVLPFGLSKDGYGLMLSRFLTPWRNLERVTNLYFEVPDGDRTVARGDDVTIFALPHWRLSPGELPEYAWLNWKNAQGETDERRMEWSESNAAYTATLPHVFTSFDYHVSAGRTRTQTYHIDVVERPDATDFTLEVVPPAYTGQATQTLEGAVGRTEVFERSQLTFDLRFNKPVTVAELVWLSEESMTDEGPLGPAADRVPLELTTDQQGGRLTMEAKRSGPYALILRDDHDLASLPTVSRELLVIPDMPPEVRWADLDPSQLVNIAPLEARPDETVPLSVQAVDDIGVHELALHLEVIQRGETLGPLPAESLQLGQAAVSHRFDVKLSDFELREGDLISVRARAVDGRPVPEPQASWSPARLIRISKDADPAGLRALMQEQQRLRDAIEQIKQDLNEDREAARELNIEAAQRQKENLPLERQPELARLAQRERDAQQRLEQLAAVFDDHPLQKSIAEDTRQIAEEPIEQAKQNLQQAEAEPIRQQRDRLRQTIKELSTADKKLDQLLKQFDELAALERDLQQLQQLAEEAEQLADHVDQFERDWKELERLQREQSLTPKQENDQQTQMANRQMDLQDEQQDLTSALDHLLEERPEILEAARQRQLKQLRKLAEQAQALAEHQDKLAKAMSREPATPSKASEPTDTESTDSEKAPSDVEPMESGSKPSESETKPSDAQTNENEAAASEPQPSPAERQQQLAADAARQALETARQQGIDSEAAQEARQFAERAREAADEAQRGLLSEAAKSAKQAAQSAEKTSERMSESPEPPPDRMTKQAESLAEQQANVAEELQNSSRTSEQRQAAQQSGQRQISQETSDLTRQFAEAAERLESEPLNEEEAGKSSRSAQEATEKANSSQQLAQQRIDRQEQQEAAEPAQQAAKSLKEAAEQAAQAGQQKQESEPSPVPGEVGEQVADARRQLDQAGQQLQQASQGQQGQSGDMGETPQPGQAPGQSEGEQSGQQAGDNPGENPEGSQPSENGQPTSENGQSSESGNQPGEAGQPGDDNQQSPAGQSDQPGQNGQPTSEPANQAASESMRQVAESLQQAAQQMGLQRSQRSQNNGQDQQSGNADQGADGPQGGYGARGGLSLAELEAELGRISARDWGQLPDRVESELQQAQQKKPDGDYARLIRLYFEEVARRQSAVEGIEASSKLQPADSSASQKSEQPSND